METHNRKGVWLYAENAPENQMDEDGITEIRRVRRTGMRGDAAVFISGQRKSEKNSAPYGTA